MEPVLVFFLGSVKVPQYQNQHLKTILDVLNPKPSILRLTLTSVSEACTELACNRAERGNRVSSVGPII